MARKASARRYAQAVFEIALETKELDRWQADLKKIVSVVTDAALMSALESPRFPFEGKAGLVAERLADISPLALNLVYLLIARGRLDIISEVAEEYQRLLNSHRGIEQAEVLTAVPLDDESEQKLIKYLSDIVKKKVIIKSAVDPGIVGGVVARIEGKLLDGSTRSKLRALKHELIGTGRK